MYSMLVMILRPQLSIMHTKIGFWGLKISRGGGGNMPQDSSCFHHPSSNIPDNILKKKDFFSVIIITYGSLITSVFSDKLLVNSPC